MRKSLYSFAKDQESEDGEAWKKIRTVPVRIPKNLTSLAKASHSKAGHGGAARPDPMRFERTPRGPRFVRRNIINEIVLKSETDLQGTVAKKFAQKDTSGQHSQSRSAQASAMTVPTLQSSMHTRNGAASTVAVVSAAAQAEVAAFPPWAWKPPPRIEIPPTPILLTGKKPSAETIRVADAFIARARRALDVNATALGTDGNSASSRVMSDSEDIQHLSAPQFTNSNEALNSPSVNGSNPNCNNATAVLSDALFSNCKAVTDPVNIQAETESNPCTSIDSAPNAWFLSKSKNELQKMPMAFGRLERAAVNDDAIKPTTSSPMIDSMRKSLASVVNSPRRPLLHGTKDSGVATHTCTTTLPHVHATKHYNKSEYILPSKQEASVVNVSTSKPPRPGANIFTTPVLGSEYLILEKESQPAQREMLDRSLQAPSPGPNVLMAEIYGLVVEMRAAYEEHIQRMARLEELATRMARKFDLATNALPLAMQQPMELAAVPLPKGLLHSEPTVHAMSPQMSCARNLTIATEIPVQEREVLLGKKQGLAQSRFLESAGSLGRSAEVTRAEVEELDKPETPVQKLQALPEGRHSTRLQDRRLKLGATTPSWLMGRSKKNTCAVTTDSQAPVSGKGSQLKICNPVIDRESRAKSEAPFNHGKASQLQSPAPVATRRSRAKSEIPFNPGKASWVKTPTSAASRGQAQSAAPVASLRVTPSHSLAPSPTVAGRGRRKCSQSPTPGVSGRGRPRLSPSPTPVVSKRGRPRRSQSRTPGVSDKGHSRLSQSPTPVVSKRGRPRRSQSKTPGVSGRGRPRLSLSPTPVVSKRGRPRRSQSRTPGVSGNGHSRLSQSPTPVVSKRGRPRCSQSRTPGVSGKRHSSFSQSPTPGSSGKRRSRLSQSPTPEVSRRGSSRVSKPAMPLFSMSPNEATSEIKARGKSSKRPATKQEVPSAKSARSTGEGLQGEVSNSVMSSKPQNTRKALDKHWASDSPLATPLDVKIMNGSTANTTAAKCTLKNIFSPDKTLQSKKESHGNQMPEHAGAIASAKKAAGIPCFVVPSEQNAYGLAPAEHSYSRSPWATSSLVADYHSFAELPSQVPDKSKTHTDNSSELLVVNCARSQMKIKTTGQEESRKIIVTSNQIKDELPPFSQACFKSPKKPETSDSCIPGNAASKQLAHENLISLSPNSFTNHQQNPFVSLERLSRLSLLATSPDFSQTLNEYWSPTEKRVRPNQEELDLLTNSPLYAWMSKTAATVNTLPQRTAAGTPREGNVASSTQTTSLSTRKTKGRMWRPSDLVKSRSPNKLSKAIAKNPFISNYKSPALTPKSLLPKRVASAKKTNDTKETKIQASNRKSLVQYQKLRKTFPKLMMTPVNMPVSHSGINALPLDSAMKTSRNVQAMLELLEDE